MSEPTLKVYEALMAERAAKKEAERAKKAELKRQAQAADRQKREEEKRQAAEARKQEAEAQKEARRQLAAEAKAAKKAASEGEGTKGVKPAPPAPSVVAPRAMNPAMQAAVEEAFTLPYEPPSYHFGPNDDPYAEIAQRELCRRKLLPFIQRFRPKYMAGWVHEDICRRIERFVREVEKGNSPRLLLLCPPRMGKSEIGSRHTPAWVLGQHPEWEIIAASHTSSLSLSFSRYLRDVMRDPAYKAVFPDTVLDASSQSVENWNLTKGGGYMAAGVGTGITGRGCFVGSTLIDSEAGLIEIEHLVRLYKEGKAPRVLAYNHEKNREEYKNVIAAYEEWSEELVEITLSNGSIVCCTPNHTVFVEGRGYIAAEVLRGGETVVFAQSVPGMWENQEPRQQGVQGVLREYPTEGGRAFVRELQSEVHAPEMRGGEGREAWAQGSLLLETVQCGAPRGEECEKVCDLREPCVRQRSGSECEILLERVSSGREATEADIALSGLWKNGSEKEPSPHVLLEGVFDAGSQLGDAGKKEPELQGRFGLQRFVFKIARACEKARQKLVRCVFERTRLTGSPHRRVQNEQLGRESGDTVHLLPQAAPHAARGTVALVGRVRGEQVRVYDLQVEEHSNYFAGTVLVHNCHILLIDDVVKDAEAAQSLTIRDNTWEWYLSTAYTRLAPGGGVLGILTWWHDDDWAGRLQQAMALGDGDNFEIVKYPAINDYGDEYILPDDSIVQLPPDQPVPEGARLTRPMNTAIHPARYNTEMMLRIKKNLIGGGQKRVWDALYQQNPIPDEGNYFSKEMFRYYGSAPARKDLYVYQAWDFAISEGKESDYTVGTCIGVDHRDNIYYLAQKRFRIQDGGFIIDEILDFAAEWNADQLGFEDGQIWKAIEFQFQKRCEERRQYPAFELLKPLTDKMVRANPLKGRMQLGKVYFDKHAPYFTELMKELLHFPAGKHDDQIDSLAWAVRLTLSRAAPRDVRPTPKVKSWKDKLGVGGALGGTHMAA